MVEIVFLDTIRFMAFYNRNVKRIEISKNMHPELIFFCLRHELKHSSFDESRIRVLRDILLDIKDRWILFTDKELWAMVQAFDMIDDPSSLREFIECFTYYIFSSLASIILMFMAITIKTLRALVRRILE